MSNYYTESQINRIEEAAYNGAIFEAGKEWERQRDEFDSREYELQSRIAELETEVEELIDLGNKLSYVVYETQHEKLAKKWTVFVSKK